MGDPGHELRFVIDRVERDSAGRQIQALLCEGLLADRTSLEGEL
jgi:hypothetical protein